MVQKQLNNQCKFRYKVNNGKKNQFIIYVLKLLVIKCYQKNKNHLLLFGLIVDVIFRYFSVHIRLNELIECHVQAQFIPYKFITLVTYRSRIVKAHA